MPARLRPMALVGACMMVASCDAAATREAQDAPPDSTALASAPGSAATNGSSPRATQDSAAAPGTAGGGSGAAPNGASASGSTAAARRPSRSGMRSTLEGVFTTDQAEAGAEVYAGMCRSCHMGSTHTATFKTNWTGYTLAELVDYTSINMPKNDPGGLSRTEYITVIAYLLHSMGMPPGHTPLPADSAALARIRFDTLSAERAPTHNR